MRKVIFIFALALLSNSTISCTNDSVAEQDALYTPFAEDGDDGNIEEDPDAG